MLNYIIDSRDKDFSAMSTMLSGMLAACRAETRNCSQATRFVFEPPKQYTEYIFQFADRVVTSVADVAEAPQYVTGDLGSVVVDVNLIQGSTTGAGGSTGGATGGATGGRKPIPTIQRNTVLNTQDYINLATNLTSDFIVFPDLWLHGFNSLVDNYKDVEYYSLTVQQVAKLRAETIKNKIQEGASARNLAEIKIQEIVQNIIPDVLLKPYEYVQHFLLARSLFSTMQEKDLIELLKSRPLVAPPKIANLVTIIEYDEPVEADAGSSTNPTAQNNKITTKVYFSTRNNGMILLTLQNAPDRQTGPAEYGNNTILGNNFSNYQLAEKFMTDNYEWYRLGLCESFYDPPKGDAAVSQPNITPGVETPVVDTPPVVPTPPVMPTPPKVDNNWRSISVIYNVDGDSGSDPTTAVIFNSPNSSDGPAIPGNTTTVQFATLNAARNGLRSANAWARSGISETTKFLKVSGNNWGQIAVIYDEYVIQKKTIVTVLNAPNSSDGPAIPGNKLVQTYDTPSNARSDLQTSYAWFRGGVQESFNTLNS